MLHIAGGTYYEICYEPRSRELYGSGCRAAAALSELTQEIKLSTYIYEDDLDSLEGVANSFKFEFDHIISEESITFSYTHGLAEPSIYPSLELIHNNKKHNIDEENVLRFGFLEGDAIVKGKRVVYDPQSAYNPKPFDDNGSVADHLAVVSNFHEARLMANSDGDILKIGSQLLSKFNAEVMVLKGGAQGGYVITENDCQPIPVFRTTYVWPIGSGDVFASIFAYYWAVQQGEPYSSATLASKAAAYYCQNRALPVPEKFSSLIDESSNITEIVSGGDTGIPKKVYLAGAFFTNQQRWILEQAKSSLQNFNLEVFSPFHDIGHGIASVVVPADITAIKESDIIFAIVDGLDPGTIFEIGYARAKDIPVIAFVQNETDENLKMLEGTDCKLINDFVTAIYEAVWTLMTI